MMPPHCGNFRVGGRSRLLFVATFLFFLLMLPAHAKDIRVMGDQLILSGPVVAGDYDAVPSPLSSQPQIKTVILRNSPGGDAPTGYHLGELFRQKSLETALSGYCYSSCSRLFLGGKERYFTDDYPPEYTQIGLHGHYDGKGDLNAALVNALHLKDWIIRYSDEKADEALVERWITYRAERGSFISTIRHWSTSAGIPPSCARASNPIIRASSTASASARMRSTSASPRR